MCVWFLSMNMHRHKLPPSAPVRQSGLSHPHRVDKHAPQQQPLPPAQQLVEGEAEGGQQTVLLHLCSVGLGL